MNMKPHSCLGCRNYDKDEFVKGSGAYPATVLFIGGSPPPWGGLFTDKAGKIVRAIIDELAMEERVRNRGIRGPMSEMRRGAHFAYSAACPSGKLDKAVVTQCGKNILHPHIAACNPQIIVPMGAWPLKALGVLGNIKDMRGGLTKVTIEGKSFSVMPTISPVRLIDQQPGLYSLIKGDISAAAKAAFEGSQEKVSLEKLRALYDIPRDIKEVKEICSYYRNYSRPGATIAQTMMSLDTETTSRYSWDPSARVIMLSGAVAHQKAFAMFLDHRESPYDWKEAAAHALSVTMSDHPKAWWNWKFDHSMFKYSLVPSVMSECEASPSYRRLVEATTGWRIEDIKKYAGVRNTRWDGLMGEHILDEDKKGFYSLKSVIKEYAPEYGGYEEELKGAFTNAAENKADRISSALLNADVTNHVEGIEPDEFPFEVPEGTTLTELKDLANSKLRKLRSELRKLRKSDHSEEANAVMGTIARVEGWRAAHKVAMASLDRAARAHKTELLKALGDGSTLTYEDIDPATLALYAAIDADATLLICRQQRKRAYRESTACADIAGRTMLSLMDRHYLPLTEILAEMQHIGVQADQSYLSDLNMLLKAEAEELEREIVGKIQSDLGYSENDITLNNPKFMGDVFIAGYGLPSVSLTAKGQASMNEASITKYIEMGNPVAESFLRWRKICKAQSTYVERLKNLSRLDHRIHGTIHLNGAATGRTSSAEPNLQNTPHYLGKVNIKKIFVPSQTHLPEWWDLKSNQELAKQHRWDKSDRMLWVDMDFSGAEVRVLTRYAPDKDLIQALLDGLDIHSWMTAEIHGLSYEEVNVGRKTDEYYEELRRKTKQVVFGTIYGITSHGLQQRMGFTEEEAEETIRKLLDRFPAIQEYTYRTHEEVARKGRVMTPHGRARRFPMANVGRWIRGKNQRQAVNFLIQSYCSDIVMACFSNVTSFLDEIRGRMLLTVHDSVCFEMPVKDYSALDPFLEKRITDFISEKFSDLPVPMPYDVKVGWNYGETEDQKEWQEKNKQFLS